MSDPNNRDAWLEMQRKIERHESVAWAILLGLFAIIFWVGITVLMWHIFLRR